MTNYCTIEEAWSTPEFSSNNESHKKQQHSSDVERKLAVRNNNCFNNNFHYCWTLYCSKF